MLISCTLFVAKCVFFCFSDCEAHGRLYLAWRLLWCWDLVRDKMVVLTADQQNFRWIRCC